MRTVIIAGLIMMGTLGARAEVVPFNVFLSSTNFSSTPDSFTIPAGKIYIIEAVQLVSLAPLPSNTEIRVIWTADNLTFNSALNITISDTFASGNLVWLPQPFRLKATESLLVPQNAVYSICRYSGLMIDEADLYAQAVPSELESMETAGGQLFANVKFGSSRPRLTTIESAVDIQNFIPDATGVEMAGLNRDESVVTIDQNGDPVKFLRVRATARN
ncbi:MAG: hypothetical protein H7A43_08640 [Verrucomicrobia bacterium]|nr:hypothetical protein [Verrucomicrobiota bacterium]